MNSMKTKRSIGAVWSIVGLTLIIGSAVMRLLPYTLNALTDKLTLFEWVILIVWAFFMVVGEGYRGFQKQFSP